MAHASTKIGGYIQVVLPTHIEDAGYFEIILSEIKLQVMKRSQVNVRETGEGNEHVRILLLKKTEDLSFARFAAVYANLVEAILLVPYLDYKGCTCPVGLVLNDRVASIWSRIEWCYNRIEGRAPSVRDYQENQPQPQAQTPMMEDDSSELLGRSD